MDDMSAAGIAALEALDESTQIIHVFFDMAQMTKLVPSLNELLNRPRAKRFYEHPHMGWSIYIGPKDNPFFQFVSSTITQNFGAKMRWYHTEDEALTFVGELEN